MGPKIDAKTRRDLEEAVREVQIIAGIASTNRDATGVDSSLSIGVTSADYGDGKTTIAMTLAGLLSRDLMRQVSLVDADFHTHSMEREYGLQGETGLAEVISGSRGVLDVVRRLQDTTMQVVPAGRIAMDPAQLARSDRLVGLMDELKAQSKYVVLDLPAALHSMNAPALAQRCDAVIVVVRHGHTTRADLDRVLHLLQDSNVIGVVLNRHRTNIPKLVQKTLGISA